MNILKLSALAATAAIACAAPASAQPNPNAPALSGSVSLRTGFTPDPRVANVVAGGTINASSVGSNCAGFIAAQPDYKLTFEAGSLPLIISVASDSDTTLVVNGPDGRWYCDDDGGVNGSNPSIRFNNPQSGRYDIFVGTYRASANAPARLHISEVGSQ